MLSPVVVKTPLRLWAGGSWHGPAGGPFLQIVRLLSFGKGDGVWSECTLSCNGYMAL